MNLKLKLFAKGVLIPAVHYSFMDIEQTHLLDTLGGETMYAWKFHL